MRLKRLNYFKFILILLISFESYAVAEQTVVEPKIIEYKGVKEEQLRKVEGQVYSLAEKQKILEEKLRQLEKIKNISPQDKQILEILVSDIQEIKQNQENLNKQVKELYNYVNKSLFLQNIIQLVIFSIFIVFMSLLYKYKKETGREIKEVNEKVEKFVEKDESEIIMNLTERAKEDPKAAEILKAYIKSKEEKNNEI